MIGMWLFLLCMLAIILISSELFTNAIEHLGQRLNFSAGVTGSIFAAIATALPETSIPIIAIFAGSNNQTLNQEVGIGAILGAPLMLATLSTFVMAVAVVKRRGMCGKVRPERTGFVRDLNFFMVAFLLSAGAMFIPEKWLMVRVTASIALALLYFFYLMLTLKASSQLVNDGHGVEIDDPLYVTKLGLKENLFGIYLQLLGALILLLLGAKGFIYDIENISSTLNISALLLSLLIIPIATELPEKINSVFWIRKNKDTLAFGNITGALVFQGTLLPAIGIVLTPWLPSREVLVGILITLLAALWMRFKMSRGELTIRALFLNGFLYLSYLFMALLWHGF